MGIKLKIYSHHFQVTGVDALANQAVEAFSARLVQRHIERDAYGNIVVKAVYVYATRSYVDQQYRFHITLLDEFKQFIYSLDCSLYFEQFIFTMIWLYFYTGIRVSEGLALYWSDIDLKKQKMSISHNLDYANKHNWERKNKLKTEKSKRVISIDDTTVEVLKDWRKRQKEFSEQFEFVLSYDLTPNDAHFVRDMITKYSKRAGVRSIQAKALRHSHASLLINEYNVTPLLIQKRLGHTDIRTTLGIYSHLYPNADEEITGQLKDLIKINK